MNGRTSDSATPVSCSHLAPAEPTATTQGQAPSTSAPTGDTYQRLDCEEMTDPVVAEFVYEDADIECGLVTVPADWSDPEGETIQIAAYRIPTASESPAEALGYDEYNLYGLSCGTRLALTAMRDAPGGIPSVVLDSVFPIEVNGMSEAPYTVYWAIDQIDANCRADADCTIDAKSVIEDGIARLAEAPEGGLGVEPYLERVLADLDAAAGDDDLPSVDEVGPSLYPLITEPIGMGYLVVCAEEAPFLDQPGGPVLGDDFMAATRAVVDEVPEPFSPALCEIWKVPAASDLATQPVVSDIPTLVVAGSAGFVTPPTWSQQVADALPAGTYVELPGLGHGVLGSRDCLNRTTLAFLDDPRTDVDTSCVGELAPVDHRP